MSYPFAEIEARWQRYWMENGVFATDPRDQARPRFYVLDMFPYPSGDGLHVGHPEGYTATDIIARHKRHNGFNVLHPMGWDAFGLPAEQYAMKTNIHPRVTTERNIANFRRQLQSLGFSYDWSREVNTTDPAYYRWTQWIFLQLYNAWYDTRANRARPIATLVDEFADRGSAHVPRPANYSGPAWDFTAEAWSAMSELDRELILANFRLVYEAETPVNWCEGLGSVLANEEVEEWTEKGFTVERRPMRQWMMRITAYADRLLEGLDGLDWPASTAERQRNWIGRSTGAEIIFTTENGEDLKVFTTRPDTLYGVTFMTIAPEHPAIERLTTVEQQATVDAYRRQASLKSERDRQASEEKTGVWTGSYAIHPGTGGRIPIWTGDYVLAGYGTGAVMGVPAHDERDFAFARAFGLPIHPVIAPPADHPDHDRVLAGEACYADAGTMTGSAEFNGMSSEHAKDAIVAKLGTGIARFTVQFKQRDWLFSRQRYWGEPIPIIKYESGIVKPLDESELPLILPEMAEFKPSGSTESPLALATDWLTVNDPVYGRGRRETNTMPQWAGSCWYYLRYIDPRNAEHMVDPELERHWMPVDHYVGGGEHAVLHLMYARFWHKALHDLGHVSTEEPFRRLTHQGLILGEDGVKMSKSRGNVINPDAVVAEFGADSLRLFEMFMGPLEMTKPWSTKGVEGVHRFLNRAWRMIVGDEDAGVVARVVDRPMAADEERTVHATIMKVTEDIEAGRFNTAISALMIFVNEFINREDKPLEAMLRFAVLLEPFAPHMAEELWSRLGNEGTIAFEPWPAYDPAKIAEDDVEIVLQVNSKIKAKVRVPVGTEAEALERIALEVEAIRDLVAGKSIRKVVTVKDKLVNVIAG
jgi:leucyl-tRNA synthetase